MSFFVAHLWMSLFWIANSNAYAPYGKVLVSSSNPTHSIHTECVDEKCETLKYYQIIRDARDVRKKITVLSYPIVRQQVLAVSADEGVAPTVNINQDVAEIRPTYFGIYRTDLNSGCNGSIFGYVWREATSLNNVGIMMILTAPVAGILWPIVDAGLFPLRFLSRVFERYRIRRAANRLVASIKRLQNKPKEYEEKYLNNEDFARVSFAISARAGMKVFSYHSKMNDLLHYSMFNCSMF